MINHWLTWSGVDLAVDTDSTLHKSTSSLMYLWQLMWLNNKCEDKLIVIFHKLLRLHFGLFAVRPQHYHYFHHRYYYCYCSVFAPQRWLDGVEACSMLHVATYKMWSFIHWIYCTPALCSVQCGQCTLSAVEQCSLQSWWLRYGKDDESSSSSSSSPSWSSPSLTLDK